MKITIEVLPKSAKPLYDKDMNQMAVFLKNGKPAKTDGIRGKSMVLVPLYPINLGTLRGIVKTVEFAKKVKCKSGEESLFSSCIITFNSDKTRVGVLLI